MCTTSLWTLVSLGNHDLQVHWNGSPFLRETFNYRWSKSGFELGFFFFFFKQEPLCYYWTTLGQIGLLYNSLISTELQQGENCAILSSQVLNSSLLSSLVCNRVIFSAVGRRLFAWLFQKPLWFPCNSWWPELYFQSCFMLAIPRPVKKTTLLLLHEIQDRNWVSFSLTCHRVQLSCFTLQA